MKMTLQEAGALYLSQKEKLDKVVEDLQILHQILKHADEGPLGSFTTCTIRTDILRRVTSYLEDHHRHLKYTMEEEIS